MTQKSSPTAPQRRVRCEGVERGTLVERALREAGVELDVIEGVEEARLIQLAVMRRLEILDKRALLIDVGGGSTELTLVDRGDPSFSISLPLGTVRVIETFLKGSGSVDRARAKLMAEQIDRSLAEARPHLSKSPVQVLIGTGGNIETLADLCPLRGGWAGAPRAIDVSATRALFARLCAMTAAERRDAYALRPDRADTIVPATAIFLRVAEIFKATAIAAPGVRELKEGILRRARRQMLPRLGLRPAKRRRSSRRVRASGGATSSTRPTERSFPLSPRSSSTISGMSTRWATATGYSCARPQCSTTSVTSSATTLTTSIAITS